MLILYIYYILYYALLYHTHIFPSQLTYTLYTYYHYRSGLQKQTNPEWVAYLFLTDDKPFEQRLLQIIDRFQDPRLRYFPVDKAHRPTVSCSSKSSRSSSVYTVYMRENIVFMRRIVCLIASFHTVLRCGRGIHSH